jgi:hypothetical protein
LTRVVVFYLDDTFGFERDSVLSGLRVVGEWAKWELSVLDIFERVRDLLLADTRRTTITQTLERVRRTLASDEVAEVVKVCRKYEPDIRLCDDAPVLPERLVVASIAVSQTGRQSASVPRSRLSDCQLVPTRSSSLPNAVLSVISLDSPASKTSRLPSTLSHPCAPTATGLPLLASPVGTNRDVGIVLGGPLAHTVDEGLAGLAGLLGSSASRRQSLGSQRRAAVESSFSFPA